MLWVWGLDVMISECPTQGLVGERKGIGIYKVIKIKARLADVMSPSPPFTQPMPTIVGCAAVGEKIHVWAVPYYPGPCPEELHRVVVALCCHTKLGHIMPCCYGPTGLCNLLWPWWIMQLWPQCARPYYVIVATLDTSVWLWHW